MYAPPPSAPFPLTVGPALVRLRAHAAFPPSNGAVLPSSTGRSCLPAARVSDGCGSLCNPREAV